MGRKQVRKKKTMGEENLSRERLGGQERQGKMRRVVRRGWYKMWIEWIGGEWERLSGE